jgi:diguanylate cyclase
MLAKGALRRLAAARLDPSPEHYARAYAAEAAEAGVALPAAAEASPAMVASSGLDGVAGAPDGSPSADSGPDASAWAALAERLLRQSDRASRQWTVARRRASLSQVFEGSRRAPARLHQRLSGLLASWESDGSGAGGAVEVAETADADIAGSDAGARSGAADRRNLVRDTDMAPAEAAPARPWLDMLGQALPAADTRGGGLVRRLNEAGAEDEPGATELRHDVKRWVQHRESLVTQLQALSQDLTQGLVDLCEDGSWVQGQAQSIQARLADGASVRAVRAAAELLGQAQRAQGQLKRERQAARAALQDMIARMLDEVGTLGDQTGGWQQALEQHAAAVQRADSLQALAGVVQTLLADSRTMAGQVAASRERLAADRQRAQGLEAQVLALEQELRRVSDELKTDALTQVANRRGLQSAFEAETSRVLRQGAGAATAEGAATCLAVGLIDIDNFKKLNDTLGHAAGDVALKSLAAQVRERLRPADHIARFGGEEFVLLLPDTPAAEAQQVLTRLQRSLTEALFLHEGREVFVTFSAGVTAWRQGEALQLALERADEALYEAKRTGKNRTCLA